MATCANCGNSGWFMPVSKNGLCDTCEGPIMSEIKSRVRVIQDSIRLINESKKTGTRVGRCDTAIEHLEALKPYERKGLVHIDPNIQAKVLEFGRIRAEIAEDHLREKEEEALAKVEALATTNSKVKQFAKLKDEIRKYESVIGSRRTAKMIDRADKYAHRIELEDYLRKAKKAEFKGNTKKALDQYLEALYLLRTDDIPDDVQANRIAELEAKIVELGGEAPSAS